MQSQSPGTTVPISIRQDHDRVAEKYKNCIEDMMRSYMNLVNSEDYNEKQAFQDFSSKFSVFERTMTEELVNYNLSNLKGYMICLKGRFRDAPNQFPQKQLPKSTNAEIIKGVVNLFENSAFSPKDAK